MKNILLLTVFLFLSFTQLNSQDQRGYILKESETSFGVGVGSFVPFYADLEFFFNADIRLNKYFVLDIKLTPGLIHQLYLFGENYRPYKMIYFSGSLGVLIGKSTKFFELSIGETYFFDPSTAYGNGKHWIYPNASLGFRKLYTKTTFRVGVGVPQGIYLSISF